MRCGLVISVAGILAFARCEPSATPVVISLSEFSELSTQGPMPAPTCRMNSDLSAGERRRTLFQRNGDLCVVLAAIEDSTNELAAINVAHVEAIDPATTAGYEPCLGRSPTPLLTGLQARQYTLYFAVLDGADRRERCDSNACFTVAYANLDLSSGEAPDRPVCLPEMRCGQLPLRVLDEARTRCNATPAAGRCRLELADARICPPRMP